MNLKNHRAFSISIALPCGLFDDLHRYADFHNVSKSLVVQDALRDFFDKHKIEEPCTTKKPKKPSNKS